jgi:hypothetical protein
VITRGSPTLKFCGTYSGDSLRVSRHILCGQSGCYSRGVQAPDVLSKRELDTTHTNHTARGGPSRKFFDRPANDSYIWHRLPEISYHPPKEFGRADSSSAGSASATETLANTASHV